MMTRALREGDLEAVQQMLLRGADLTPSDQNEVTALHWVAYSNSSALFDLVVQHGALERQLVDDPDSFTALDMAANRGNAYVLRQLFNNQGLMLHSLTEWSRASMFRNNHVEAVSVCVDFVRGNGWYVGYMEDLYTALALEHAAEDIVGFLLEQHELTQEQLNTHLESAVNFKNADAASQLIEAGADVTCKGYQLLKTAIMDGSFEVVQVMLDSINKVSRIEDEILRELINAAARSENADIMYLLVRSGIRDLSNRRIFLDYTPLHWAVEKGCLSVVLYLFRNKVSLEDETSDGSSVLHLAARKGKIEMLDFLIARGCDVNKKNRIGCTPLHYAARFRQKEAAEILVQHGASIATRDLRGMTPLDYAIDLCRPDLFDFLE